MHDHHGFVAAHREQLGYDRDDAFQARHVVAERIAEAAPLDEVALHVDDHERRRGRVEGVVPGLSANDEPHVRRSTQDLCHSDAVQGGVVLRGKRRPARPLGPPYAVRNASA